MDNLKAAQETLSKYQEEDFFPDQQEVQCSQVTCESEAPELKSDNEESQETKVTDSNKLYLKLLLFNLRTHNYCCHIRS